ncbi:phosphatase PAP2 family protein [Methylobacterium oryzae]|uniref:phosphatase PAP2 family protein n=1 Tax=Methylobacterium TaxID=407 RepID=UPI003AF918DE
MTYLTLAALLARIVPRRATRHYFVAAGNVISLTVGISRVALRVHWPTDVLAGGVWESPGRRPAPRLRTAWLSAVKSRPRPLSRCPLWRYLRWHSNDCSGREAADRSLIALVPQRAGRCTGVAMAQNVAIRASNG